MWRPGAHRRRIAYLESQVSVTTAELATAEAIIAEAREVAAAATPPGRQPSRQEVVTLLTAQMRQEQVAAALAAMGPVDRYGILSRALPDDATLAELLQRARDDLVTKELLGVQQKELAAMAKSLGYVDLERAMEGAHVAIKLCAANRVDEAGGSVGAALGRFGVQRALVVTRRGGGFSVIDDRAFGAAPSPTLRRQQWIELGTSSGFTEGGSIDQTIHHGGALAFRLGAQEEAPSGTLGIFDGCGQEQELVVSQVAFAGENLF